MRCGSVRGVGERAYVDVPFAEKDEAERCGARWDMAERRWYAPPGRESGLSRWAPAAPLPAVLTGEDRTFGSGLFVDLIPASCWFTNVRSCVSARDWDRLRTVVDDEEYECASAVSHFPDEARSARCAAAPQSTRRGRRGVSALMLGGPHAHPAAALL
jgi:hypothetical protein